MKHLLCLSLLCAALTTHAQSKPETDGAYYSSKEADQARRQRQTRTVQDSTLSGIDALDAKNGFRGYVFGTPIDKIPGIKPRYDGGYSMPRESMMIGDVRLNMLRFFAYNGQFSELMFATSGNENTEKLLAILEAQYGKGHDIGYQKQGWIGNTASLVCEVKSTTIGYSSVNSCIVYMYNNELIAQRDAEKAAAAKKAAGDL